MRAAGVVIPDVTSAGSTKQPVRAVTQKSGAPGCIKSTREEGDRASRPPPDCWEMPRLGLVTLPVWVAEKRLCSKARVWMRMVKVSAVFGHPQ